MPLKEEPGIPMLAAVRDQPYLSAAALHRDTQVRDLMAVLRENSADCQASKSSPVQRENQ